MIKKRYAGSCFIACSILFSAHAMDIIPENKRCKRWSDSFMTSQNQQASEAPRSPSPVVRSRSRTQEIFSRTPKKMLHRLSTSPIIKSRDRSNRHSSDKLSEELLLEKNLNFLDYQYNQKIDFIVAVNTKNWELLNSLLSAAPEILLYSAWFLFRVSSMNNDKNMKMLYEDIDWDAVLDEDIKKKCFKKAALTLATAGNNTIFLDSYKDYIQKS